MAINNYIKWPAERIRQDENNRLISDVQITTWNGKADSDHNHDDKYVSLENGGHVKSSVYVDNYLTVYGTGSFKTAHAETFTAEYLNMGSGNESGKINFNNLEGSPQLTWIDAHVDGDLVYKQYLYLTTEFDKDNLPSENPTIKIPAKSGTIALTSDVPSDYIPLSGTRALIGDIVPSNDAKQYLGTPGNSFANVTSSCYWITSSKNRGAILLTVASDADTDKVTMVVNRPITSGGYAEGVLSFEDDTTKRSWIVPAKDGTFAMTTDIPTTLPASDVKDWAKADSKPTYTFAEITEKPDKFTPDTHTHTITEVTDLQTALDGKAAKNHVHDSEKVTNWNNAVVSGVYYAEADAVNNPSADAAYSGNVVKGSTIVTQTVVKETIDGDLYKYIRRGQLDTNRTTVTTWGQWQEIQYVVTE